MLEVSDPALFYGHMYTYTIFNNPAQKRIYSALPQFYQLDLKNAAKIYTIINERSEFFRSLSEKSEYERPGSARGRAFEMLISPRLLIRFPYGFHRGIVPFKLP